MSHRFFSPGKLVRPFVSGVIWVFVIMKMVVIAGEETADSVVVESLAVRPSKVVFGGLGERRKLLIEARLASGVQVNTQVFLEGMELTALRAAYAVTGDLALSVQLLRQPDPGPLPVSFGRKLQDLLGFSTSEAHFELRERLGMAIGL